MPDWLLRRCSGETHAGGQGFGPGHQPGRYPLDARPTRSDAEGDTYVPMPRRCHSSFLGARLLLGDGAQRGPAPSAASGQLNNRSAGQLINGKVPADSSKRLGAASFPEASGTAGGN